MLITDMYHHGGHTNGLGVSFMVLITVLLLQEGNVPQCREATADVWCFSIVSLVLYDNLPDRCDLSAAMGEKEHFSPLTFTPDTLVQKTPPTHQRLSALPSVHNSQLWHFVSAVLHFLNSVEIIIALSPPNFSPSPAGTPPRWQHPSPINHHISSADWCLRTGNLK